MRLTIIAGLAGLWALGLACSDPADVEGVPVSAEWTIPGLEDEVSVLYTEMGIPHVFARTSYDLHRAQGFVAARDRFVHFELMRRLGSGRLAEILGELGVPIDIQSRTRGLSIVADHLWNRSSETTRSQFSAFADGVNDYVSGVERGDFPVPEEINLVAGFLELRDPRALVTRVEGKDVAALAAVVVSRLGFETGDITRSAIDVELGPRFREGPLADLRRKGLELDILAELRPVHPLTEVPREGRGLSPAPVSGTYSAPIHVERGTLARLKRSNEAFDGLLSRPTGQGFGSNSWAVAASQTADGRALLANDGHLPLTMPTFFYQMCLDSEYFGDAGEHQCGLYFPGLPLLAVGTNGKVAWGQTYLNADITDWFAERVRVAEDGKPTESFFQGQWRAIVPIEETYLVAKGDGTFDTVVWSRFETFDGRLLTSIEGRPVDDRAPRAVAIDGAFVAPEDVDGDGVISAVSFDWTGLDAGSSLDSVLAFSRSESVDEFIGATRKLIGYAQNVIVADAHGDVAFTAWHALPCRASLTRTTTGWALGADPQRILDGSEYGGFEIGQTADGTPTDSEGCIVGFDVGPRAVRPASGFVWSANHDPLGLGLDGKLWNEELYIGGPWDVGYRAKTIHDRLTELTQSKTASLEAMSALQNDHHSVLGLEYLPALLDAVNSARAAHEEPASSRDAVETRLATLYEAAPTGIDEAMTRLEEWVARGASAESGVETFYDHPSDEQRRDAVATMIFNQWIVSLVDRLFLDEQIDAALADRRERTTFRTLHRLIAGRGSENPLDLASFNPETHESAFFDDLATEPIETSREQLVAALVETLAKLGNSSLPRGEGGFETPDMSQWLWGLKHQVRIDSLLAQASSANPAIGLLALEFSLTTKHLPLAEGLAESDPRSSLQDFPRHGDFFNVDDASPSMERGFFFDQNVGPVMRMVIALGEDEVSGVNILPGGQSGESRSPHYADQAALWLENKTVPLRFSAEDAVAGATRREVLRPE